MDAAIFWSGVSSALTLALLVVTGVYAWLTHRLAKAAERQLWEQGRPRIIVALRTNQGGQFLILHVENVGAAPAENLVFELDRPVHQDWGERRNLQHAPLFSQPLRSLSPSTPIRFGLGVAHRWMNPDRDRNLHPSGFSVRVSYKATDREVTETFPVDVEQQYLFSAVERDHLDEFGKNFPDRFDRALRDLTRVIADASEAPPPERLRGRSWAPWFGRRDQDDDWD